MININSKTHVESSSSPLVVECRRHEIKFFGGETAENSEESHELIWWRCEWCDECNCELNHRMPKSVSRNLVAPVAEHDEGRRELIDVEHKNYREELYKENHGRGVCELGKWAELAFRLLRLLIGAGFCCGGNGLVGRWWGLQETRQGEEVEEFHQKLDGNGVVGVGVVGETGRGGRRRLGMPCCVSCPDTRDAL